MIWKNFLSKESFIIEYSPKIKIIESIINTLIKIFHNLKDKLFDFKYNCIDSLIFVFFSYTYYHIFKSNCQSYVFYP
jgi:hypothetical protein